jgi:hypothetical protein
MTKPAIGAKLKRGRLTGRALANIMLMNDLLFWGRAGLGAWALEAAVTATGWGAEK